MASFDENENEDLDELLDEDIIKEIDEELVKETPTSPKRSKKKRKKKLSLVSKIVIAIALCVFLYSAYNLFTIFLSYHKAKVIYEEVESTVLDSDKPTKVVITGDGSTTRTEVESPFVYDHSALLALNSDGLGYIYIPAINIRLPFAQCEDNDYYLKHTFTGEYSENGCLFLDYRIEEKLNARQLIIYGHSMKDGSMFGKLHYFGSASFTNSEANRYIYIYTGNVLKQYKIFSVYTTDAISDTYAMNFGSDSALRQYAETMKSYSYFDTGVDVSTASQVITLSTCTGNDTERFVVQATYIGSGSLK